MLNSFNYPMLDDPFDASLPPNPYPGLRPFYSEEWPIFFGREAITDEIISLLTGNHFILVHGDSGCGKSSIVRAGVLVQLQQGHTATGQNWRTCAILPRNDPLGRLAEALAGLIAERPSEGQILEIRRILKRGKLAPVLLSTLLCKNSDDQVCILIDQFEEIFRFAREHDHREAQVLIDILTGIADGKTPGLYAILTMRSEFFGYCSRFDGLAEALNKTQYLLPRMGHDSLRSAIQDPAKLYGGRVSSELAEKLMADVKENQDELPLIQHGLKQLWRSNLAENGEVHGRACLDVKDMEPAQSPQALLDQHASTIQRDLLKGDNELGNLIEYVFRSLTDVNADGQAIRRPLSFGHLKRETGAGDAELREVLRAFRAEGVSFITPYGSNRIGEDEVVDISHEALIRAWSQLSDTREGWLWKEFNAGLTWRTLRFQADRFTENRKDRLSRVALDERASWISSLPSPSWCERYGDGREGVVKLFGALTYRWSRVFSVIFMFIFLAVLVQSASMEFEGWLERLGYITGFSLLYGMLALYFTWRWLRGRRSRLLVKEFFSD